jgi:hypothetical protein
MVWPVLTNGGLSGCRSALDVSYTGITSEGVAALVRCSELCILELYGCNVSQTALTAMAQALPRCQISI